MRANKGNKYSPAGMHDKAHMLNIQVIFQLEHRWRWHIGNQLYQKVKAKYMLCKGKSDNGYRKMKSVRL